MLANTFACKIDSGILFSAQICNPEINVLHLVYKIDIAVCNSYL